jgi:hypothetical protein
MAVSFLYAALINLIKKKITKFGVDAFFLIFLGEKKAMIIRESAVSIRKMGIVTLIIGISSLNAMMEIFIEKIWPFIR